MHIKRSVDILTTISTVGTTAIDSV